MKKVLIGLLVVILLLVTTIITVPVIFKDDIKKEIDKAIAENVNAKITFSDLDLTLIKNFPNLTVSLQGLSIENNAPFEGTKLLGTKEISITVDIMSVINGEKIQILGFLLDEPIINVIVKEDGSANYDIAVASTDSTTEEESTEESAFDIGIKKWEIRNGSISYIDETMPIDLKIEKLNHTGNGDFNQDVFDLMTKTELEGFSCEFDGTQYLDQSKFVADLNMNIDNANSKYTFKENSLKLNDFGFYFDGWLSMSEAMEMDITYGVKETEFAHVLSLVPGVFMEGFENMKTEGNFQFDGFVKGIMDDSTGKMPAFNLNLQIADAMFQYPDLPSAVKNITVDLKINSEQDQLESMEILLNKFHLDMGANPIDAKALVKLQNTFDAYDIDADVNAKVNLGEITQFYPVEGTTLKGLFAVNAKVKGIYDSLHMPNTNAQMNMSNGYVKSADLPTPLENINFDMNVQNQSGELANTIIDLKQFSMLLDGEPVNMKAYVENLDSPNFDVALNGTIDFEKLTKIIEFEDMTLKGKMVADIKTKGSMKDVEAENYAAIPTSGQMSFSNFYYSDPDLPNGFKMDDALFTFTPKEIKIEKLIGMLGRSDIDITGGLTNYINYIFGENQTLVGVMNFNSNKFDVNEWMEEEPLPEGQAPAEEEPLEVVELPTDIDFTLQSNITKVLYDNMELDNMTGKVILKNGIATLDNVKFGTIGGQFAMNGSYDPTDKAHPKFDFDLDIQKANIGKAYATFNTIQQLAPIAKTMDGLFSTNFKIDGELDQEMMPNFSTVSGKGLINILEATANTNLTILDKIAEVTKLDKLGSQSNSFTSMLLDAEIKNGRLFLKPFVVPLANGKKMNVSGSNGIDGTLDYIMSMKVPTGQLGSALTSQLSGLPGGNSLSADEVDLNMNMLGTHENPIVKLLGVGNSGGSIKDNVKQNLTNTVDAKKDEAEAKAKAELETKKAEQRAKIISEAETQAAKIRQEGKSAADKTRKEGYAAADKLVKDAGNNPIKKKLAEESAKKMKSETDKKANRIQDEANSKANKLVSDAKAKAARI